MTPDQSRAIAAWFGSNAFRLLQPERRDEIRRRVWDAADPWEALTTQERGEANRALAAAQGRAQAG